MDFAVLQFSDCVREALAAMLATMLVASLPVSSNMREPPEPGRAASGRATIQPTRNIFISGHSLTDTPFPDQLAEISRATGHPASMSVQNASGSSIKDRRPAFDVTAHGWAAIDENQRPDTMIITEQHTLLGNLVWNDTVSELRHAHDALIDAVPTARTFLFASWLGVDDQASPLRWIAYERAAAPVWQCVAARVNLSLQGEGRLDRIQMLPAASALAWLVEQLIARRTVHGHRVALDEIFRDDVHLTPAGSYYVALISYSSLHGRPPQPAWRPADITSALAEDLETLASQFMVRYRARPAQVDMERCRAYIAGTFVPIYLAYQRDTAWAKAGTFQAYAKWARHRVTWPRLFRSQGSGNPFHDPSDGH